MAIASLQPLRKSLLSENVFGSIREAILKGEFDLGQRLVETELAEQLGVSRGPVREALRLLAIEGLVVINVHRGTFVVEPTAEDVEEIYSLREALELLAVQRVVKLAEDEELEELAMNVRRFQDPSGSEEVVVVNMEFHNSLFKLTRHKRLLQSWATLESQLRLCNSMEVGRGLARTFDDHINLLNAIQRRDAEEACSLMSRHILTAAQVAREVANLS